MAGRAQKVCQTIPQVDPVRTYPRERTSYATAKQHASTSCKGYANQLTSYQK